MSERISDRQLAELLANPSTWAEARPGLEDTIVEAVMNDDVVPDDEPIASPVTSLDERRRRGRNRRRLMVPAAAAAAVVAVFGFMVSTSNGAGPAFTAEMAPTAVVANAHGSARIDRNSGGFRISLDADGLEPLTQGQYYEAWLKDAAGTLVPIGTFSSSEDHITLWSGVSPEQFTTLTVTIETPDNNQSSSGHVVLHGDIHAG